MSAHVLFENALSALARAPKPFVELFRHGTLAVELYAPRRVDRQNPHTRDEVYVIARGSGSFLVDRKRTAFTAGDVLFVAASVRHRFVDFSTDFATWVFFYGPEGGEPRA